MGHALTPYILKPVNGSAKTTETEKHDHSAREREREIFALRWGSVEVACHHTGLNGVEQVWRRATHCWAPVQTAQPI